MKDRYLKVLLSLIVLALWGLLLRPLFLPTPALAQAGGGGFGGSVSGSPGPTYGVPAMLCAPDGSLYVAQNGCVDRFSSDLKLLAHSNYGDQTWQTGGFGGTDGGGGFGATDSADTSGGGGFGASQLRGTTSARGSQAQTRQQPQGKGR
ncbi:MAG TPA: hypothetical protein VGN26_09835 [Armatimonadota bacterium]|jgi:hypothetical protein